MKINLTQLKIEQKGTWSSFVDRHSFQTAVFWARALNPKAFRAHDVGYELHKKACIKAGYQVK